MSSFNPSKEQLAAIDAEGENYLISAGAGSGKTAVLTKRIYRLVKKTKRLDNFLILTFTVLAASQMKERIRDALAEDPELEHLATEVDNAHIENYDSFYLYIVNKYFYKLGIEKDISILDNSILEIKYHQIIKEILKDLIVSENPTMLKLLSDTCFKTYDQLEKFIVRIIQVANTKSDKEKFYFDLKNKYCGEEFANYVVNKKYETIAHNIRFLIEKVKNMDLTAVDYQSAVIDYLTDLLANKDYTSLVNALKEARLPTKNKGEIEENESARKSIGPFFNGPNIKNGGNLLSEDEIKEGLKSNYEYVTFLVDIVLETERQIDEYKKKHNSYTFSDISRMVLALLKDEEVRKEISDSFDYIMVDEYQDTSDIQEEIINIIGKDNIYMVGDIKQSIYRFRNADCQIFNEKFNDYKANRGGKEIDLNASFRSRKEIVDFINDIFSNIMTLDNNSIDYNNGHHFGFGQKKYGEGIKNNSPYKTEEYRYQFNVSSECPKIEADMIAKDIAHRINNKFQVYDFKLEKNRDVTFKDFAIIIDREGDFNELANVFADYGIPLKNCGKEQLMSSDVNVAIKNVLKLLYYAQENNYGEEYRHSFISVARSFLVEMSDQEIYDIMSKKETNKILVNPLALKIELLKERLRFTSLKEVLETLYQEFDLYNNIIKITKFYENTHKAEVLLNYAEQMDKLGLTLKDLIEYFDNLTNFDLDVDYRDTGSQENSVTLINIHQSKGLEYNIVYYPLMFKAFNIRGLSSKFQVSKDYGIILPGGGDTLYWLFFAGEKQEQFEEKIRLLYVALTRAKQKIILIRGGKQNSSEKIRLPYETTNLSGIYELGNAKDKYLSKFELDDLKVEFKKEAEEVKECEKITLKSISVPSNYIKKSRASKQSSGVNEDTLQFGTNVHAYLEGIDLDNRDTSYIKDYQYRKIVNNVVNSPLFKGVNNSQVRHEFSYYDEVNNVNGTIDCLIEFDDKIYIIDFKLKNIDEEEYDNQLRTYKKYIAQVSDKPIYMYLLAAITGEIREVKDE